LLLFRLCKLQSRNIGLVIFKSPCGLIGHPEHRKVHDYPYGAPEGAMFAAFAGFGSAYVIGLVSPKDLLAIGRGLIPPLTIRSSSGLA
jgi:hypothetical protein